MNRERERERERSIENGREGTNGGRLMVARGALPRAFNIFEPIAYQHNYVLPGPVRGRKVRSGPFPFSLSLSAFTAFSDGAVVSFSPFLSSYSRSSLLPSQNSGQLLPVHRLESGKFLMGYYGVHSAYQRDSYGYNTRATSSCSWTCHVRNWF